MGMIDIPDRAVPPYDTVIKRAKEDYKTKHRKFLNSEILGYYCEGFRTDEVAKIVGRSEAFVVSCLEKQGVIK